MDEYNIVSTTKGPVHSGARLGAHLDIVSYMNTLVKAIVKS